MVPTIFLSRAIIYVMMVSSVIITYVWLRCARPLISLVTIVHVDLTKSLVLLSERFMAGHGQSIIFITYFINAQIIINHRQYWVSLICMYVLTHLKSSRRRN